MRYIYIIGILLLLVIGFLLYYYWDQIWVQEGFQASGAIGVYQLFEQRCTLSYPTYTIGRPPLDYYPVIQFRRDNVYYPTVPKSTGREMCRLLGGRMATYSELNEAVTKKELIIDTQTPAMVIDSDITYSSNNKSLIYTKSIPGFQTHNQNVCAMNNYYYDTKKNESKLGPIHPPPEQKYVAYNNDGYSVMTTNDDGVTKPEKGAANYYCSYGGYKDGTYSEMMFQQFTPPAQLYKETYGNPVCIGPVPTTASVQIEFPSIIGRGWASMRTIGDNALGNVFTREFHVRTNSSTPIPFVGNCNDINVNNSIPLVNTTLPQINLNPTITGATTASSYKIIDLDVIHSQVDIAKVDLPVRRDVILETEIEALDLVKSTTPVAATNSLAESIKNLPDNPFLAGLKAMAALDTESSSIITNDDFTPNPDALKESARRLKTGYSIIMNETAANTAAFFNLQADFSNTMRTMLAYYDPLGGFLGPNQNKGMTMDQFGNVVKMNVDSYYTALLNAIEIHPIAFLRRGVINFPSLLNTFKTYNFPPASSVDLHLVGGLGSQPKWKFMTGYNSRILSCVDGLGSKIYNQQGGGWDTREGSQTVDLHNPSGWWCSNYSDKTSPFCPDGYWGRSWRFGGCVKEYYRNQTAVTDSDYMINIQPVQAGYDIYNTTTKYKTNIDSAWRPVKDSTNTTGIPTDIEPTRTVAVIGTISAANIQEIEASISLALCLNFTDTAAIESQIRISSQSPYGLYMSADASALPEFTNVIKNQQSILSPANAAYNFIHCAIPVDSTKFYLLPYHTRNMIIQWATARYARIMQWVSSSGAGQNIRDAAGNPISDPNLLSNQVGSAALPFIAGSVPPQGSFFQTTITADVRNAFLDSVAKFYYEHEKTDLGSTDGATAAGYATINKFVDVYQIGNTIFDVRFEEHRMRGLQFQKELQDLDAKYKAYKAMNLSKEDQIELESRYLKDKTALYAKDRQNIWGTAQDCGVAAQYITITSNSGTFNLSQIVVINTAGQNVALAATIYSPPNKSYTSPDNLDYGSINDDPRTKYYYDSQTGNMLTASSAAVGATASRDNTLAAARTYAVQGLKASKEALLTDGTYKRRYEPSTYKTVTTVPDSGRVDASGYVTRVSTTATSKAATLGVPIILDLGQSYNISVVRIIFPANVTPTDPNTYTVKMGAHTADPNTIGSAGSNAITGPGVLDSTGGTLTFSFPGSGADASTCPSLVYTRFKTARFYTTYTPSTSGSGGPWTVTGYSKQDGDKLSALTFDPKYNAGLFVDTTVDGGNMQPAYYPKVTYSLNRGGIAPPLNCSDPDQITKLFNEYNLLVNSDQFRASTVARTQVLNNPNEEYTAITVKQVSQDTAEEICSYVWTDKVYDTSTRAFKPSQDRLGMFHYPFDTENFNAYERVLDLSGVTVVNYNGTPISGMQSISGGFTIPEMYTKSTTLDTAGGFCPALQCSDTQVMQSILNVYNMDPSKYGTGLPAISKIHKAITPTPNQCEYLVETVGSAGTRKILFNVNVYPPHTQSQGLDADGNRITNDTCLWIAPFSQTDSNGNVIAGVVWDGAPHLVDSTPYLTRMYNYALDIMRPFSKNVTSVVTDLVGLGSAQLDSGGSGIVNALLQYRTETAAAAGDIRYFDDTDEFGNRCAQSAEGSYSSANYPRCRSGTILNSLYQYYAAAQPLSTGSGSTSSISRIRQLLRAGLTDDGQCDYTFTRSDYNFNGATSPPYSAVNFTSGLRCGVKRIPFSCDYEIDTSKGCKYINPTPTVAEVEAIPTQFVQNMSVQSGSGSSATVQGSSAPPLTTAALNASGSQVLNQPPNPTNLLRSIDYIDCKSDYANASLGITLGTVTNTNKSLTQCTTTANGRLFVPPESQQTDTSCSGSAPSVRNLLWSTTPGTAPTGLTLLTATPSIAAATVQALLPYTIVPISPGSTVYSTAVGTNSFEYRISVKDTLAFGDTFIRAQFYGTSAAPQLASLVTADPTTSPNAFFAQVSGSSPVQQDTLATTLANTFITYWNGIFTKNNNVGNKIGSITGYYINRATDSIIFQATSAMFGPLGKYDIQYYYPTAYYTANFRKRYSDSSITILYKVCPQPNSSGNGGIVTTSGSLGSFRPISVSSSGSGGSDDPYVVQDPKVLMALGYFRSFQFTVTKVTQDGILGAGAPNPRTRAEISRIYFYSNVKSSGSSGSFTSFQSLDTRNAVVQVEGTYANYTSTSGSCNSGYVASPSPTNPSIIECTATQNMSYTATKNNGFAVACGIGYYLDDTQTTCIPSGFYQDVLNPAMVTTNQEVPRLRLNVGQKMTIDFNNVSMVNTFSFVLGSAYNRPLQWTLIGSINNIDWIPVHSQTTDFPYAAAAGSGQKYLSFYTPGYFTFSSGSAGSQIDPIGAKQLPQYSQMSGETVEGFTGPDAKRRRFRTLRWKILETQRPDAPYVHASKLQFHTKAGVIPADLMKISNPHGTRRSPADGPAGILSDNGKRWVDYNKTELLVTFDLTKLPGNSIYGFQFAVPSGIPNSIDYLPARWLLEASYDGRTWIPIHEKSDRARILGEASPIYKFSQQM